MGVWDNSLSCVVYRGGLTFEGCLAIEEPALIVGHERAIDFLMRLFVYEVRGLFYSDESHLNLNVR